MRELFPGSPALDHYYFPPEWNPHRATWLSWPHKEESWPGKIEKIFPSMAMFVKEISEGERVCINILDEEMKIIVTNQLQNAAVDLSKVELYMHPTNDAWCRDHGPAFLLKKDKPGKKAIVDWGYNAWGNKYPPYDLDDVIPSLVASALHLPVYHPPIVMEGGSVDFNGAGTLLTTTSCLLNKNRNPSLSQNDIESYLFSYYGVEQVLWLGDGIVGDDTDGHIDDITRFVNEDTVVTVVESDRNDENFEPLDKNLSALKTMRLLNGKQLNIIEIPMPKPFFYEGVRLPASYANFYISNAAVIVPLYQDTNDEVALDLIAEAFPERKVVGIDSTDIIWGLGSFHCLSQQEPL